MKRIIRLTESDLTRIVKRVIRENENSLNKKRKLNESVLLTLGGLALGADLQFDGQIRRYFGIRLIKINLIGSIEPVFEYRQKC